MLGLTCHARHTGTGCVLSGAAGPGWQRGVAGG